MFDWQFLLQKKGCLIWEAIDSRQLTIEAGIYRILGRGNCQKKEAEISCTYQDFSEQQNTQCLSKKVRRIDPVGLVMISPFTYFNPGYWEFICRSATFEEILGQFWYESFQLQVLPEINSTEPPRNLSRKKRINLNKNNQIDSSSILKLQPISKSFKSNVIFNFPQKIPKKAKKYSSKAAEFFASRKPQSLLLYPETLSSLAGVSLNLIHKENQKLIELFLKIPVERKAAPTIEKPAQIEKTRIESLPAKLNLPEIKKMVRISTKLRVSLGQILPPKIASSSNSRKRRKYPQLPKIDSAPIPTINISKQTSFKIQRNNKKNLHRIPKNNRDSIDLKFAALKSKERFWERLQSLTIPPKSDLDVEQVKSKTVSEKSRYR